MWKTRTAPVHLIESIADLLRKSADGLEHFAQGSEKPGGTAGGDLLDEYVEGLPTVQNMIDVLPGWNSSFPAEIGVTAGRIALHNDPRILWALEQFGSCDGRRILELGPLEASHTFMIERHGPASIDSVEANKLSFLRCLVAKELLGLKLARFHLGDFVAWLEETDRRYDLIVASGVLYHMADPIRLMELMAARCDAFFLWTHYTSDEAMPPDDARRRAFVGDEVVVESHGVRVRMRDRSYLGAWKDKSFCGGMRDRHKWIEKDDILALIRALGFTDVRIAHDEPGHAYGPSFSVFARRPSV
jgi:hypothetical protein